MPLRFIANKLKSIRWPHNAATTIALLALAVSCIQLVVTAPLLSAFFFTPKIKVDCSSSAPTDPVLAATCTVVNQGNAPATKLEITITTQADQRVNYLPDIVSETISNKGETLIKNTKIEVDRLLPGEEFIILATPGPNLEKLNPEIAKILSESNIDKFPYISYVRYAEGIGTITYDGKPLKPAHSPPKRIDEPSSKPANKSEK